MKSLKFTHIEAENIKRGVQTATLRIGSRKRISVDDEVAIIDKVKESDPSSWTIIGTAKINKVVMQRIGDLELVGAEFERFGSMAELYRQMAVFYGDPINKDTHIEVIYFDFKPYEVEKSVQNLDVNKSTEVSEIKLYGDGGSRGNPGPAASGFVIMDMQDNVLESNGEYLSITTNNQAEYHSLRLGLERARQMGVKTVHVYMDSLLVINQMKGVFRVKNEELKSVHAIVKGMLEDFDKVTFTHVPRELNKLADAEVNRILDSVKDMV